MASHFILQVAIYICIRIALCYPYHFASRYPFDTFPLQSANPPHSEAHLQNSGPILSRNHSPKSLQHSVSVSKLEPGSHSLLRRTSRAPSPPHHHRRPGCFSCSPRHCDCAAGHGAKQRSQRAHRRMPESEA
jgi:hypothetical protein